MLRDKRETSEQDCRVGGLKPESTKKVNYARSVHPDFLSARYSVHSFKRDRLNCVSALCFRTHAFEQKRLNAKRYLTRPNG